MGNFKKNDSGFICAWCGKSVEPLGYTSRDHCPHCLVSLHVDINPGDRANTCCGYLIPNEILTYSKRGYVINYKCSKCGKLHNNISSIDDNFKTILTVMNKTYNAENYKQK